MGKCESRCFLNCFQNKQLQEAHSPLHESLREGGRRRRLCYSSFSAGDVGADRYGPKCFSSTFIEFDSNDNVVPPNQMMNGHVSPSHTHCFYFPLEPPE